MILTIVLVALAVLAHLGRSLVMLASVAGIAVALWATRKRPWTVQVGATFLGAVLVALAAEVVHVVHHATQPAPPEHGGFWVSAVLVGLINAAVTAPAVWFAEWWRRRTDRSVFHKHPA